MRGWLRRLDDAVYRVEQVLCLSLLAVMAAAVFLDVVHRQGATQGPFDRFALRAVGEAAAPAVSTAASVAVAWLVAFGALRSAKRARPLLAGRAALLAGGLVGVGYGAVRLLLFLAPNGLIWAQPLALSAMLWVGVLGASMVTKEGGHLTLEISEFLWKGKAKGYAGRVGMLVASAFCVVLAYLCWRQVRFNHQVWVESEGLAGLSKGFGAPLFAVYAVLPVTFGLMAARFFGRAVGPSLAVDPEPEAQTEVKR